MKNLLKAIWNIMVLLAVIAIVPAVFMIDMIRVYVPYFFGG